MAGRAQRIPHKRIPTIVALFQYLQADARDSISRHIVMLCTGGFLALAALHLLNIVAWSQALAILGLSYDGIVHRRWLFQLLTAPLLHANLTHLAFNMLTLWMLGPDIETVLGRRQYVGFSALCAGCAMLSFLLWDMGPGVIACGYSGVIFGILVAQATFFPDRMLYLYAFFPLRMKHAVLVLGAVELYLTVMPQHSGIAHAGHLCGAIGAWLYLRGWRWWTARARRPGSSPLGKPGQRQHHTGIPWEL